MTKHGCDWLKRMLILLECLCNVCKYTWLVLNLHSIFNGSVLGSSSATVFGSLRFLASQPRVCRCFWLIWILLTRSNGVIIISYVYHDCVQVREMSAVPYCEDVVYYSGILKACYCNDLSLCECMSICLSVEWKDRCRCAGERPVWSWTSLQFFHLPLPL